MGAQLDVLYAQCSTYGFKPAIPWKFNKGSFYQETLTGLWGTVSSLAPGTYVLLKSGDISPAKTNIKHSYYSTCSYMLFKPAVWTQTGLNPLWFSYKQIARSLIRWILLLESCELTKNDLVWGKKASISPFIHSLPLNRSQVVGELALPQTLRPPLSPATSLTGHQNIPKPAKRL